MSVHIQLPSLSANDFLFPFLSSFSSSSCFTNPRHSATQLVQKTQKQKSSHFPIFSAHRYTNPTTTIPKTTTASTSTRKPVAVYLMKRLGFTEEESLAISKKYLRLRGTAAAGKHVQVTDLISLKKVDNVVAYLQKYCGLELSHIKKAVTKYPTLLAANVDKTLKPKIKLLKDLGFSTSDLALVLSANPFLYLACDLAPAIQALRGIMGSDEDVVKVLKGLRRGTAPTITKSLIPNVTMLENEYGIPRDKLIKFLTKTPYSLMRNTESLRDVLVRVEDKWGITRDSSEFLRAIQVLCSNSDDNIDSKCQVFRSYGWSDSDILSLIRRSPNHLSLSEAGIKNKLNFYMNELGYKPAYMASRTALFSLSLENRVVPRHRVLSVLKEKRLIKDNYHLYSALLHNEYKFSEKFILPYVKTLPELRQLYIDGGRATSEAGVHMETSEPGRKTPSAGQ